MHKVQWYANIVMLMNFRLAIINEYISEDI